MFLGRSRYAWHHAIPSSARVVARTYSFNKKCIRSFSFSLSLSLSLSLILSSFSLHHFHSQEFAEVLVRVPVVNSVVVGEEKLVSSVRSP